MADNTSLILERWKSKISGIKFDPPVDYKTTFWESVRGLANKNHAFLDVGTGVGKVIFVNDLSSLYRKVVGIDIMPEMISICKNKAKEANAKNLDFKVMDAMDMDFTDGSFDVVSSMFSPVNFNEAYRVLSPGGYLVCMYSLEKDHREVSRAFPEAFSKTDSRMYKNVPDLNRKLEAAGFSVTLNNVLHYKWLFKDEETLVNFYEKITFSQAFSKKGDRLAMLKRRIDMSIPVTRVICTTVAKKT
ncbi:MAG: class I SAM-dependent methyltransferase [Candidatus Marsarchaeota archaeon]|nr:class I SAM-dependent methyltransferase [Candidatus Marsarchaeota archaeon]